MKEEAVARLEGEVARLGGLLAQAQSLVKLVESRTVVAADVVASELVDRVAVVKALEEDVAQEKEARAEDARRAAAIQEQLNGEIMSLKDEVAAAEQKRGELMKAWESERGEWLTEKQGLEGLKVRQVHRFPPG